MAALSAVCVMTPACNSSSGGGGGHSDSGSGSDSSSNSTPSESTTSSTNLTPDSLGGKIIIATSMDDSVKWAFTFYSSGSYTSTHNLNWLEGYSGTYTYKRINDREAEITLNGTIRSGGSQKEVSTIKLSFLSTMSALGSFQQTLGAVTMSPVSMTFKFKD